MEEIVKTFGIDVRLIAIQLFNFGLLLALLVYFLYKPILKMIDERKAIIEKGVRDAEAAGEKLMAADNESKQRTDAAHKEGEAIVARAKEAATATADTIVADAHTQSSTILKDAEARAHAEAERLKRESEKEIARVAILAAEKVIREKA